MHLLEKRHYKPKFHRPFVELTFTEFSTSYVYVPFNKKHPLTHYLYGVAKCGPK